MEKLERVCDLLELKYGKPVWDKHNPPLDELILTTLSQNTIGANCRRAFAKLKDSFPSWRDVMEASTKAVAESIRIAGLSAIRAARIQNILRKIYERRGELDLDWLNEVSVDEARDYLLSFDGVGPKTAACVLLFSLCRPVMPVDTHVYRVCRRVGLIEEGISIEAAHEALQRITPADRIYSFHMNTVRLGREICRPQAPKCADCILNTECGFGQKRSGVA